MSARPDEVRRLIEAVATEWAADPDGDVVWTGEYEGRIGLRMRQRCRDFTTVWFAVGERTVGIEAFLFPQPHSRAGEVYRQCLVRNVDSWPVHIALDRHGDLVIIGRIPLGFVSFDALDTVLGSVHLLVERSFRSLVNAAFPPREK